MSIVAQDHVFLSALQPKTAVSTYAVPSEIQLGGNGATLSDEMTRGKRVQQQVAMRLAEKSSTLPRQNGSASHYTSSEHGGSSTMKYQTFNPGFSSKSYVYTGSRPVMVSGSPVYTASTPVMTGSRPVMAPNMSQYSGGFSSHSAVDLGGGQRVTMGGGGRGGGGRGGGGAGGGGYTYLDDMRTGGGSLGGGGYQGGVVYRGGGGGNMRGQQMSTVIRTMSRGPGPDPEASLRSMRLQNLPAQV
ncbi:unnamed protein product [Oncorhynchus mykiss]|uniref:Uncharacterized protein n=1 Tax=Oncorhynchus mykiss TaxID=8022 RepID=A0A060YGB5_ONCMY|nr:unnamed protein product [Oncorhynchus mykiss]